MKVHCLSLAVALLATLVPSPAVQAQGLLGPRPDVLRPATGARVSHVVYDVQEQRIRSVRQLAPGELGIEDPPCFDNSIPTAGDLYAWAAPNVGEELVAWGTKLCRETGLVRRITFAYGSHAQETSQGGPGAELSVALYRGTRGFGVLGTQIFRATVSGLPSGVAFLTFDFGTRPLLVPDGRIGWSAHELDGTTGLLLVRAPRTILGTADALDVYAPGPAPTGVYLGTFNYGGCSGDPFGLCASLFLQIDEVANSEMAGSEVVNGTGINPLRLSEIQPAQLDRFWSTRIDLTGVTPPAVTLLFVSEAPFGPVLRGVGEVLVDPSRLFVPALPGQGFYSLEVPEDASLAGLNLWVQGAVVHPGASFLTNALRVTVGF